MKYREGASSNSSPISIHGQVFIASVQNCEKIITKIENYRCHRNTCIVNIESNHYRFVNALLRSVIGPENSHHSFNQSDSKLKPITTWSPTFSRVSGCLVVFYLDLSYGSVKQKLLLRQSRQSTEPFKQVLPRAIYSFNSAIYIIVTYLVSLCRSPGTFQFSFAYFAREWWFLMLSFKAEIGARLAKIDHLAHARC